MYVCMCVNSGRYLSLSPGDDLTYIADLAVGRAAPAQGIIMVTMIILTILMIILMIIMIIMIIIMIIMMIIMLIVIIVIAFLGRLFM